METEPPESQDSTTPGTADGPPAAGDAERPAQPVSTRETTPVWAQKHPDPSRPNEAVAPLPTKGDPDWSKPEPSNGGGEKPAWAATVPTDPGEPIEEPAAEVVEAVSEPKPAAAPITEPPRAVAADAMKSTWPPAGDSPTTPPAETDIWPPDPPTERAMPAWPPSSELTPHPGAAVADDEPETPAQPIPSWPDSFDAVPAATATPAAAAPTQPVAPTVTPARGKEPPAPATTAPPVEPAAEPVAAHPAEPAEHAEAVEVEAEVEAEAKVASTASTEPAEAAAAAGPEVPPTLPPAARADTVQTVKPAVEEEWNPEPPPPLPAAEPAAAPQAAAASRAASPTPVTPAAPAAAAAAPAAAQSQPPVAPAQPAAMRPSWAPTPGPAPDAGRASAAPPSAVQVPAWAPRVPLAAEPGTPTWFSPKEQIPHTTSQPVAHAEPTAAPAPMPVVGGQLPVAPVPKPQPEPQPQPHAQPAPQEAGKPQQTWEVVQSTKTERSAPQGPTAEDRSYAEWFAWAKRGGAPASACHAAAQGAFKALAAGKDLSTAVQWATAAMSRPPENVSYTRQTYCAWFSLATIDLNFDQNRSHAFANAALHALDAGQDAGAAHAAGLAAAGIR